MEALHGFSMVFGVAKARMDNGVFLYTSQSCSRRMARGSVMKVGHNIGWPGTFTYRLSNNLLVCEFNDSPRLSGPVRYDAASDTLIYELPDRVILHLRRENDKSQREFLDTLVGATNYHELLRRLSSYGESIIKELNATNLNPNTTNQ